MPLAALALALSLPTVGTPATPAPSEVVVDVSTTVPSDPVAEAAGPTPAILYINGCFDGGCLIDAGATDSSISQRSSLLKGTAQLPPYGYGRAHFDEVVDCVRDIYAPFGITVTTDDPGDAPHFETIVAGMPSDIGYPAEIGGVAPFTCGEVPNAVSFVFPGRLGGNARRICETIAHESAHPWGLEHTFECQDTMTYLSGCGDKHFVDDDMMCGENEARPCKCNASGTQNSYQLLMQRFGAANPTPPSVQLMSPSPGQRVDQGFTIRANAADDTEVRAVELWIDGVRVETRDSGPWEFVAPPVTSGPHTIEVRALDDVYTPASAQAQVVVGSPCSRDDQCEAGQVCASDVCVAGPAVTGGLGSSCTYGDDCESGMCTDVGANDRRCVMPCNESSDCPTGFTCDAYGAGDPTCMPAAPSAGCNATGSGECPAPAWFLALASLALVLRRRRC